MSSVIASAPGKIILFGEHVVVHGCTALAACVDLRTYVKLEKIEEQILELDLPLPLFEKCSIPLEKLVYQVQCPLKEPVNSPDINSLAEEITADYPKVIAQSISSVIILYILISRENKVGLRITVKTKIPVGVGLGSSAAYNTSLSAAFLKFFGILTDTKDDLELINKYAFQVEKVMHGNPSGIDNSTSCFGGVIAFTKGKIECLEGIPPLKLIVTNTKVSRNTKALVANVGQLHKDYPLVTKPLFDSVQNISQITINLFKEYTPSSGEGKLLEIEKKLEDFVKINQHILCALGVGHPSLDKICSITNERQLQSKLTGAGGGGCAYTLVKSNTPEENASKVIEDLKNTGYDCYGQVNVGGNGVRIESGNDIPI